MQPTITLTDQMGREVQFNFPPKRIVSLVPSQTELLYYLGLTDEVVGQTLFCIHPQDMHQIKPRVGGTKNVKPEKVAQLQPDLIIGNKEENEKTSIELLAKDFPVWMSDIKTLADALEMIAHIGRIINKKEAADFLIESIKESFHQLISHQSQTSVLYLIWRKPWMAAGKATFIDDMLTRMGLGNALHQQELRYPQLTNEDIVVLNPKLIFLSSEPYPFKEHHIQELQELCPTAKILLVDGELFSWYGSRLLHSAAYFKQLLQQINPQK